MLRSKIHRARVTAADRNYEGSITLDPELMEAAGILPLEQVHVLDIDNGARLETYVIPGERGSGAVEMNGAAARLIQTGDTIIVLSYALVPEEALEGHEATLVLLGEGNRVKEVRRVGVGEKP